MTTNEHTEQSERDSFEAAVKRRFPGWLPDLFHRTKGGEYSSSSMREWWAFWQDRALLAADKEGGEVVATVYTMEALVPGGEVKYHATVHKPLPAGTKLYTRPLQTEARLAERVPLTEEQIKIIGANPTVWKTFSGFGAIFNQVRFARAIEAAHGIGKDQP